MNNTIKKHIESERVRGIKNRERAKKVKEYHQKILESGNIADVSETDVMELFSDDRSYSSLLNELKDLRIGSAPSSGRKTPLTLPQIDLTSSRHVVPNSSRMAAVHENAPALTSSRKLISMSTALGGKIKRFGEADIKRKKKKRKKKRKN